MSTSVTRVRDKVPSKLRDKILTRGARKRAGLPPPTPLFRGVPRFKQIPLGRRQKPSGKIPRVPGDNPAEESDSSSDGEPVTWVQCDNKQCQKWRRILPDTEVDLSRDWFCHMHPDPTQQSCEMPEVKIVVNKKRNFTFSRLGAGELVWARMRGYCPWPAVVSPDPWSQGEYLTEEREGCIYHLEFLGKPRSHCWLPEEQVEPYHGSTLCSLGPIKHSKKLDFALQEAESLLPLASSDRVGQCEYQQDTVKVSPSHQLQGLGHSPKEMCVKSKTKGKKCPLSESTNLCRNVTQKLPATDEAQAKQALFQMMLSSLAKQSDLLPHLSLLQSLGISLTLDNLADTLLKTSTASTPDPQSPSKVEESSTSNVISGVRSCTAKSEGLKPSLQRESSSHLQPPRTTTVASTGKQKLLETQCRKNDTTNKSLEVRKSTWRTSTSAGKPLPQENPLPRSAPLHVSPRLTQTALRLCADKTVQLTTARTTDTTTTKKKKGSPSPSGSRKRHKRESPPAATHTIPELFRLSDSPTLMSYPAKRREYQGHNVVAAENLDQQVPEQPEFLQLESDAQTEMKEIEEMLSLIGSGGDAVGSPLKRHGDLLAAENELEPHIDSVMAEMTQIEGLIQDLTKGQVVPY